jgi:hypothetical protein
MMPKEIFPSSFKCDCGHQSDFFEGTVNEMKRKSRSKEVRLGDGCGSDEHFIVFRGGEMGDIQCPKQRKRKNAPMTGKKP